MHSSSLNFEDHCINFDYWDFFRNIEKYSINDPNSSTGSIGNTVKQMIQMIIALRKFCVLNRSMLSILTQKPCSLLKQIIGE